MPHLWNPPIWWSGEAADGCAVIVDQTKLPAAKELLEIRTPEAMWEAIQRLRIRGAPAIGIAAAYALFLGARESKASSAEQFAEEAGRIAKYLESARPTAVNLSWALNRALAAARRSGSSGIEEMKAALLREAREIHEEDVRMCRAIGENGQTLLRDGADVITHCNAGGLATSGYGTALGVIFSAAEHGKRIHVYMDETRPLWQGARLTAWELREAGIPATLICDNTAAFVMQRKKLDAAIVGADRIAANGDTANKIGTYGLAVAAAAHGVPFYVAAPYSTFDLSLAGGHEIPIEERAAEEITRPQGLCVAPEGTRTYSPAFDVTPARLIAGIVTERGILRPPFSESIAGLRD